MKNSRHSPLANMVIIMFTVSAMIFLARDGRIRMIVDFLFRRGEPNLRRLEFIWRADPQSVIIFGVFVMLGLVSLISLIRMLLGLAGAIRSVMAGVAGRIVPEAMEQDVRRGQDRYLEQLDGFLRDGMVTREQYDELVRLYQRAGESSRKNKL